MTTTFGLNASSFLFTSQSALQSQLVKGGFTTCVNTLYNERLIFLIVVLDTDAVASRKGQGSCQTEPW